MSRIGARPITIEEGVVLEPTKSKVTVRCGEKELEISLPAGLKVEVADNFAKVIRDGSSKDLRAQHGLIARLLRNAIIGAKNNFTKELEFTGTGYRAAAEGDSLVLNMGYSHPVRLSIPEGIKITVAKNSISVTGISREAVGAFAADIRDVRPPEVYKGKGIKYKNEFIRRKAGKTAASK
ncbi:MAG: 50S ribosomal protein L6 [Patescibacteria group bacterium]|jgi:large subunit ribosomal protein L6